jgi:hypothetical protein
MLTLLVRRLCPDEWLAELKKHDPQFRAACAWLFS